MSTTLEYNGVQLIGVETIDFMEDAVYDQSGSDVMFQRFTIRVRGMCHQWNAAPQRTDSGATVSSGVDQFADIRAMLLQPRRDFSFKIGGTIAIESDEEVDADNGPHPQNLRMIAITGTTVIRIEFTIVVSLILCENGQSGNVVSNRWSAEDDIDEHGYSTRTVNGRIRVAHQEVNPQDFRYLVLPSIPKGFKRSRMTFRTAENGLEMDYTIIDKAYHRAPPFPAMEWKCRDSISTVEGQKYVKQIYVWLKGPPDVDRKELIATAVNVMEARIGSLEALTRVGGPQTIKPQQVSVVEHVDSGEVECIGEFEVAPEENALSFGLLESTMGKDLTLSGYSPYLHPVPVAAPTGSLPAAFAMFAKSPCAGLSAMAITQKSEGLNAGNPVIAGDETKVTFYSEGTLASPKKHRTFYSTEHKKIPYEQSDVASHYVSPSNKVALPVAVRLGSQGSSQASTTKFITLFPRSIQRVIKVKSSRIGTWPNDPAPEDTIQVGGITARLLDSQHFLSAPEMLPGGGSKRRFQSEVTYVYALEKPPAISDPITVGTTHYDEMVASNEQAKYKVQVGGAAGLIS